MLCATHFMFRRELPPDCRLFPSGLVAFAAATGVMPLDMPESVHVRFKGIRQPGVTVRDLVHAIPLFARKAGLLTLDKANKKSAFSGRILEISGLDELTVEEAFELTDASAERSASAATMALSVQAVCSHLEAGMVLIDTMVAAGYQDAKTLQRRKTAMQRWLDNPSLLRADLNAAYAAVLEIDLSQIREPIVCSPNDPDDAKLLSEVSARIDEVFIGSCMTNASHFRNAGSLLEAGKRSQSKLRIAPPTHMDADALIADGTTETFANAGARHEVPGCSLCMGNQARVADGAEVVSTSTRNFPNRMGKDATVYLASAEVAVLCASLGRLPTVDEYHKAAGTRTSLSGLADEQLSTINT